MSMIILRNTCSLSMFEVKPVFTKIKMTIPQAQDMIRYPGYPNIINATGFNPLSAVADFNHPATSKCHPKSMK